MPQRNPVFEKALALLAHPLSLFALGLMLINDHLLRLVWPSWWTGKLSDVAWLFLAPFVLAALLAWVIPGHGVSARRDGWVFGLSFLVVGVGFSLMKLLPAANQLVGSIFTTLIAQAPSLVLDPTDLLALPALGAAFWLWRNFTAPQTLRPRALIALPLAALLLLADAAAPDPGITCFELKEGQIYAVAGYESFVTTDGGLTWAAAQPGQYHTCASASQDVDILAQWREFPGPNSTTRYRYQTGVEIQRSDDGGQTWRTVLQIDQISEAERTYYAKSRPGNPTFETGPLHALPDQASGNMLFAMGHQGILVYTPQHEWIWAMGSNYQHIDQFPNADAFFLLLGGMIFLAAELVLMIYSALALRWTFHWLRLAVLIIAALGWLVVALIFPPALSTGYTDAITSLGILAVGVLILPLVIEQTVRLARRAKRSIAVLAAFGLLGGLLFFLPYVLWLYSTLPGYSVASIFAFILAAVTLAAGFVAARRLPKTS